jgi:hypothetical protein
MPSSPFSKRTTHTKPRFSAPAQEGRVSQLDAKLLAERDKLAEAARTELHQPRLHAAREQLREAETTYLSFILNNHEGLVSELATLDHETAGAYEKAHAEVYAVVHERLGPLEVRHRAIRNALAIAIGGSNQYSRA